MNDPWDVKSVIRSGQYVSCVKINGVPILPPVLSQECRKEMQYYKLLAKEVEKRICILKPLIQESDSDSPDRCISPTNNTSDKQHEMLNKDCDLDLELDENIPAKKKVVNVSKTFTCIDKSKKESSELHTSKSNKIQEIIQNENLLNEYTVSSSNNMKNELPERDCEWPARVLDVVQKTNDERNNLKDKFTEENVSPTKFDVQNFYKQDGPSSLSSKSFTGSLIDIHSESMKEKQDAVKLIRQRSYTVLTPSPQLLAHLEIQSLSTGVEVTSISMSESLFNLNSPKKRRSWDLESAKMKWSNMAMELNKKNLKNIKSKTFVVQSTAKRNMNPNVRQHSELQQQNGRGKMNFQEKNKLITPHGKPQTIASKNIPHSVTVTKQQPSTQKHELCKTYKPLSPPLTKSPPHGSPLKANSDDPATCVRDLYEKIQKQQLVQMATLIEKQKKEQILLQQVFEEQNKLLYRQLKTICPKSPNEIKQAWEEDSPESNHGPVSLSQVINDKSPGNSLKTDHPVTSTLTDTKNYIHHCDDVLKKSRDISNTFKRNQVIVRPVCNNFETNKVTTSLKKDNMSLDSRTPQTNKQTHNNRSHSPNGKNLFKGLGNSYVPAHYDTSSPSDREYEEPILTDRTNDTLADLNFTFTDDSANESTNFNNNTCIAKADAKQLQHSPRKHQANGDQHCNNKHESVRSTAASIATARNVTAALNRQTVRKLFDKPMTTQEREAATKIVAYAKGFLVRRLMKTERIQETVQTIRDALLCALQLHQDREGIRGADIDLHRRLIQQITAACYTLHDTFVANTPAERCAIIAADRVRKQALANRQAPPPLRRVSSRPTNIMSQSHSGVFPAQYKRTQHIAANMTQSNYETFSGADKSHPLSRARLSSSAELRRRPWR